MEVPVKVEDFDEGSYHCVVCFHSCRGCVDVLHCTRCVAVSRIHGLCAVNGACPQCNSPLVGWADRPAASRQGAVPVVNLERDIPVQISSEADMLRELVAVPDRLALLEAERGQWLRERRDLLHDRALLLRLVPTDWLRYFTEAAELTSVGSFPTGYTPELDGSTRVLCGRCGLKTVAPEKPMLTEERTVYSGTSASIVLAAPRGSAMRICSNCVLDDVRQSNVRGPAVID